MSFYVLSDIEHYHENVDVGMSSVMMSDGHALMPFSMRISILREVHNSIYMLIEL